MAELAAFLSDCVRSGNLFTSACALFIVPALAWVAIRVMLPAIRSLRGDNAWQASLAALAAVIPGLLVIILSVTGVLGSMHSPCLSTHAGRVLFTLLSTTIVAFLARATIVTLKRGRQARAVELATVDAAPRLQRAASRTGVRARELPCEELFCALVGFARPVVVVSRGTLARLSEAELDAALLHERGHARRGDQAISAILSFLVDLCPLPSAELVSIYRYSREFAADDHALQSATTEDLAGALLTFARSRGSLAHVAALGGDTGVRERLTALLRPSGRGKKPRHVCRFAAVAALLVIFAGGLAPAAGALARPAPCEHMDMTAGA